MSFTLLSAMDIAVADPQPVQGARVRLDVERFAAKPDQPGSRHTLEVFTSRPDLLGGATFILVAPEHRMLQSLTAPPLWEKVKAYAAQAKSRPLAERTSPSQSRSGLFLGSYAVHPLTGWRIPVWVSEYVAGDYPLQAWLGIPAHDSWQFAFARTHKIDVAPVIRRKSEAAAPAGESLGKSYKGAGVLVDSGDLTGAEVKEAKGEANPAFAAAVKWLKTHGKGDLAQGADYGAWVLARRKSQTPDKAKAGPAKTPVAAAKPTAVAATGASPVPAAPGGSQPAPAASSLQPSPAAAAAKAHEGTGRSTHAAETEPCAKTVVAEEPPGGGWLGALGRWVDWSGSDSSPHLNMMVGSSWLFSKPRMGKREPSELAPLFDGIGWSLDFAGDKPAIEPGMLWSWPWGPRS